ncbi:MAG: xanthine dehydrogenase family protein molybdopterin-binding subunit [Lautropia sp.]
MYETTRAASTDGSRQEDPRLVTGTGRFTADWHFDGQVHAAVVRSDRAHARLLSIDTSAARAAPGVLLVLTADDVAAAGFGDVPSGPALKGANDTPQRKAPMPLLARERVRFVGQPIAMVVAQTAALARDAAEQVAVAYEDLPAVIGPAAAARGDAAQLHESVPGNLAMRFESGDRAAVDAAFARARRTSRLRIASQRLAGAPMELRACVAVHDAARNVTRVHTPTQGMLGMRNGLAAVTNWPVESIEVVAMDVGGSFGLRGGPASEQALCMLAARTLSRPVKWVASRSELFVGEWHGRALVLDGEIAIDDDDRILAIRFDDQVDLGGYSCHFGSYIGTRNLSVTMGGVYRVPALYMQSHLYYTNTVPVSAYRGAGRPDIAFAIERLVDHAAAEHGLDRAQFRRRNFIEPSAFPYRTANGTEYDCGEFDRVMSHALALGDWDGFDARREQSRRRGRLRGIGFSCYIEASGAGAGADQVAGRFSRDGHLWLNGLSGPSGQGHETSFTKIVGDALGLSDRDISYRAGAPDSKLTGNGTGGSRSLYGVGSAFKALAAAILAKAMPLAAQALGSDASAVRFEQGRFLAGNREITLAQLARSLGESMRGDAHPLDADADAQSGTTFPNGCHLAELEIDPDTGVTEVVSYVAVDDLGNVISPLIVAGQVQGGVVQGLGQAFGEQIVYDEQTGQLLTGSFMDYAMPRAGILPAIRCEQIAVPTRLNALGAKGVGESGCTGSLPAVSNAMMHALRDAGVGPIDMPYTPARVWEALNPGS